MIYKVNSKGGHDMSDLFNSRMDSNLMRDIFIFEDENNPRHSQINRIWPPTVLDQVFDQLSPIRKNLREILDDLRHEIITGGIGNINFPVVSVNGQSFANGQAEVSITPINLGLGRVDNTRDIDKPLSVPQRQAVMDILSTYNFNLNMKPIDDHLLDQDNPHSITIDQINKNDDLTAFVNTLIGHHSLDRHHRAHPDIRRGMSTLWLLVETIEGNVEQKIRHVMDTLMPHMTDINAHSELFILKENLSNKTQIFNTSTNNNHMWYPSTRAVIDYVENNMSVLRSEMPSQINNWISDLKVTKNESELPPPNEDNFRRVYHLTHGGSGFGIKNAVAVCRRNTDGSFYWDVKDIDSYSLFDKTFFKETPNGLSLNIPAILSSDAQIDEMFVDKITGGMGSGSLYDFFLRSINIIPGTTDGTLRFYIQNDQSTMSDNIYIPGLQSLAYRQWITEEVIRENAVHNRHLLTGSVDQRVLGDAQVFRRHLNEDIFADVIEMIKRDILERDVLEFINENILNSPTLRYRLNDIDSSISGHVSDFNNPHKVSLSQVLNNIDIGDDSNGVVPILAGGTGANNPAQARINLGVPNIVDFDNFAADFIRDTSINHGHVISLSNPHMTTLAQVLINTDNAIIPVKDGGTGAQNPEGARVNLEVPSIFEFNNIVENIYSYIKNVVSGTQFWLPAVSTFAQLPTPPSQTRSYLCRVTTENNVYQFTSGDTQWRLYSENTDFLPRIEFDTHRSSRGNTVHQLAGGTDATAGFSQANFLQTEKTKLSGIANNANNYTHPAHTARNTALTGANVYSNVTVDASGHVTNLVTRALSAADVGLTPTSSTLFPTNHATAGWVLSLPTSGFAGGAGHTSMQQLRNSMGLGNTTGAVPQANGGTGHTSLAAALAALPNI